MEFEDFTCIHEAKFKDGRFIFKYDFEEHKKNIECFMIRKD